MKIKIKRKTTERQTEKNKTTERQKEKRMKKKD